MLRIQNGDNLVDGSAAGSNTVMVFIQEQEKRTGKGLKGIRWR